MTCDEQSCHYAGECTDLDKQKQQSRPCGCSLYIKKGTPDHFVRMAESGWV